MIAEVPRLSRNAAFARLGAACARWVAACAVAFAALLVLAVVLSSFERTGAAEPPEVSASAYLDFDLAVLRAAVTAKADSPALHALWAHRPDWRPPPSRISIARIVPLTDAWAAATSGKSRFRTAARGAADALPFLVAGLALAFFAAAAGGALARTRWLKVAGVYALVVHPLWVMLDPAVFYDRTHSLGLGLSAALFVAGFAGTLSGAASRALFAGSPHARHLATLHGKAAPWTAARLAALDAAEWLVPLVPALAAAALFVCAKADQDPALEGASSGLGALIRVALGEPSAGERLSSCALIGGALVVLWFAGHRLVVEARSALRVTS